MPQFGDPTSDGHLQPPALSHHHDPPTDMPQPLLHNHFGYDITIAVSNLKLSVANATARGTFRNVLLKLPLQPHDTHRHSVNLLPSV